MTEDGASCVTFRIRSQAYNNVLMMEVNISQCYICIRFFELLYAYDVKYILQW